MNKLFLALLLLFPQDAFIPDAVVIKETDQLKVRVQLLELENAQLRYIAAQKSAANLVSDLYRTYDLKPDEYDFDSQHMQFIKHKKDKD